MLYERENVKNEVTVLKIVILVKNNNSVLFLQVTKNKYAMSLEAKESVEAPLYTP